MLNEYVIITYFKFFCVDCCQWLDEVAQHAEPNAVKMLIGNKCDLEQQREIGLEEAVVRHLISFISYMLPF